MKEGEGRVIHLVRGLSDLFDLNGGGDLRGTEVVGSGVG